jgi:ribonuclease D
MSKTEQKSNWEKRPLDREQLRYAALDTAYLESIWNKMKAELENLGLLEEAISEFVKLTEEVYKARDLNAEVPWYKFPNIHKFTPEQRRNIYDILQFREEKARRSNKATFRVINNDTLTKLVTDKPDEDSIVKQYGKKDGAEIFRILNNPSGPPFDKVEIPKIDKDITPKEEITLRYLHKWRDKIMKKRNMDHTMLLSNKQFLLMIRSMPMDIECIRKLGIMSEWKIENYGQSLLRALNNEPYDDLIQNLKSIPVRKS